MKGQTEVLAVQELVLDGGEEPDTYRLPAPSTASTVACVAVAASAAAGASWLGIRWRGWAAERIGRDYVAAGLENTLAACWPG